MLHSEIQETNSVPLGSSRIAYNDPASEDEEPYPQDFDHDEVGSEGSWDETRDKNGSMLPAAALTLDSETPGERTPQDVAQDGMLARDIQRKTAYYDYAAEKQMSQADAKLFYQRSQLEAQITGGSTWGSQASAQGSPVMTGARSVSNMSNVGHSEQPHIRRSDSTRSIRSGQNQTNQSVQIREIFGGICSQAHNRQCWQVPNNLFTRLHQP